MVEDVGDGEIVGEGGGHQRHGRSGDGDEHGHACPPRRVADAVGGRATAHQGYRAGDQGIDTQGERQQQRITTKLGH